MFCTIIELSKLLSEPFMCFLELLCLPVGASCHAMILVSSWSTSSSPRWSATPSMRTCSRSRPCWRSRPKSIRMMHPRTPSCVGPRACSPPKTSGRWRAARSCLSDYLCSGCSVLLCSFFVLFWVFFRSFFLWDQTCCHSCFSQMC